MQSEKAEQIKLSVERQYHVITAFRDVIGADGVIRGADWYTEEWLGRTVQEASRAFDHAFDRWRELYRAAVEQRDTARTIVDRPKVKPDEKREAEQREREARRELELLLNQTKDVTESDSTRTATSLPRDSCPATASRGCRCARSSLDGHDQALSDLTGRYVEVFGQAQA